MNAKLKKSAVTLTITMILLSFTLANVKFARSNDTGGKIDLFTQKEPYSGKGPNMPSDAFGPQEVAILYALVTYNEILIQNLLVAFNVNTPKNASFSLTARTNSSGIATVNFTVLTPPTSVNESEVFGVWLVWANVLIDGAVFQDTLTFKVDWIVKLISVRTIDENLTYRTNFGKEGDVGLEITLRSVAMSIKSALLAIVIQDELNVPVNSSEIRDFEVQPNEKLIFLYYKLHIPKWAYVGRATIFVSALTALVSEGGVPYCPPISTDFFITPYEPLVVAFHDVAVVNVVLSATSVELGQPVSLSVVVRNEGTEVESFNVSAHCDAVLIRTLEVTALLSYSKVALNFTLDTHLFDVGNYTITVSIPYLANEADLTDNIFVDGVIEIKPKIPTIIHDIAIVNVNISKNSLYIDELLQINVTIVNKGTETETFDVGTYYDFSLIETLRVSTLASNAQVTLIFVWNTSFVLEGFYQISASAPLPDDINVLDNTFVDGLVEVKAKPPLTHLLCITSSPISGVNFTINGTPAKTPYSATRLEGVYTIAFPPAWSDPTTARGYIFSCWEDSSTNPTRTINLVSDIELTAHYEEVVEYTLTINTTIGGTTNPSPGSYRYPEGTSVTVTTIPDAGYEFDHWTLDGAIRTENPITIVMDGNHTLTAYFKAVPTHTLSITSEPILGVEFTIDGVRRATPYSATLEEKSYTIIMPASVTDSRTGKVYKFREWEDGSTNLTRTIFLDRDTNLTAYYEEVLKGWFVPVWFYLLLLLLLILVIILLIIWLYRRKRRKKAEEAFYSGWTAWYYCYDLRSKIRKV